MNTGLALISSGRSGLRSSGFSLIELMIAMVIGSILMAGIILVFASNKQSYEVNNSFAKVQESGRHAVETLLKDVRLAGYWGGFEGSPLDIQNAEDPATAGCNGDTWGRMASQRIYGLNDTNDDGTATGNYTNAACIPGAEYLRGDILTVRHAAPFSLDPAQLVANRNYIITDIDKATLFMSTTVPGGFFTPSSIHPTVAHAYYVSMGSGRCNIGPSAGQTLPSLLRVNVTGPGVSAKEEIITGVQDFQVQYGIDVNSDGSLDEFLDADAVLANWANVIAVRIWLLLRAPCPEMDYTDTPTTYTMAGVNKTCPANVRCQLFTTTIRLRNPRLI